MQSRTAEGRWRRFRGQHHRPDGVFSTFRRRSCPQALARKSQSDRLLARSDNVLTFYSPTEAISWAVEQGAFVDSFTAEVAYEQLKAEMKPRHAKEMVTAQVCGSRKTLDAGFVA